MPGTEELLARLQQLEDGYYGDKEAARQKNFFDTYGARFSNNRGIGLAILNELDARGIDTSAADEAVQQILDTLRTECNEIIESIKEVQQDAIENAQKVEAIQNVVSEVTAQNPDASVGGEVPSIEGSEVPPDPNMQELDPNAEVVPEGMDTENSAGSAPEEPASADQGPAPEPPAPEESAPADQGPAPEEPDPTKVTSDARLKQFHDGLAAKRARRLNSFKPSAGMLEAASRGF